MRLLFGCLAVVLGVASISLAARYGYKGADTEIDGVISAVVFGTIALCAFLFDAAAVRLWFQRHRVGAVIIGFIAALALIVTFTNSLGAIAGRADITQAERERTKTLGKGDERHLERLVRERAAMQFTTADQATVDAAREAATAAERIRERECGNGDPKQRGSNCRLRESEEQAKRDALTAALADRAATERAASLDRDIAKLRTRLEKALPVNNPNPLGAALEQILGQAAAALTAWQQAIVAAVFELCLVGVMVIYELLGYAPKQRIERAEPETARRRRCRQGAAATGKQVSGFGSAPQGCRDVWQRQELRPQPCIPRRRRAGRNQAPDAGLSCLVCPGERDASRRQRIPGRARETMPQARYRDQGRRRSARVLSQRDAQDGHSDRPCKRSLIGESEADANPLLRGLPQRSRSSAFGG